MKNSEKFTANVLAIGSIRLWHEPQLTMRRAIFGAKTQMFQGRDARIPSAKFAPQSESRLGRKVVAMMQATKSRKRCDLGTGSWYRRRTLARSLLLQSQVRAIISTTRNAKTEAAIRSRAPSPFLNPKLARTTTGRATSIRASAGLSAKTRLGFAAESTSTGTFRTIL